MNTDNQAVSSGKRTVGGVRTATIFGLLLGAGKDSDIVNVKAKFKKASVATYAAKSGNKDVREHGSHQRFYT